MKSICKNELAKKLSICGQVAEHKSEKMQQHGRDDAMILDALTGQEQEELDRLLSKLQSAWLADHKAHHMKEEG